MSDLAEKIEHMRRRFFMTFSVFKRRYVHGFISVGKIIKSKMEIAPKKLVLHLVGSVQDIFDYKLNLFYASGFDLTKNRDFDHVFCLVRPKDRYFTFVQDLSQVVSQDGSELRNDFKTKWFEMSVMIEMITKVVKPTFVVPHIFCIEGATTFRAMFEMLNVPFIGSSKSFQKKKKSKKNPSFYSLLKIYIFLQDPLKL